MNRSFMHAILAALAAASLLMLAAGSASASRSLEIRPREFVAEGVVELLEPGFQGINCTLLITAVLNRTVAKTPMTSVGNITRMEFTECVGFPEPNPWIVRSLNEAGTPATILYSGFLGSLPEITGILVTALRVGLQYRSSNGRFLCLYSGSVPFLMQRRLPEPKFQSMRFLAHQLLYFSGEMECNPFSWTFIVGSLQFTRATMFEVALL